MITERALLFDGVELISVIQEIHSLKKRMSEIKEENKDLKQNIQILWDYLNAMTNFNKNAKPDSKDSYKIPLDLYKEIYQNAKLDLETKIYGNQ